jgi:hypothetical protein
MHVRQPLDQRPHRLAIELTVVVLPVDGTKVIWNRVGLNGAKGATGLTGAAGATG